MVAEPELLAPAGGWDCLRAAAANGADAVYFGLPKFNARMRADNFTEEELPRVVRFAHRYGVKAYVAFNTLIFTDELEAAAEQLRVLNRAGVDALIVQDVGLVKLARQIVPELPIHASTQMTITSPEGAAFAYELGCERVVLARETSLRELEKFDGSVPLEAFVHGALCVAYSGQCLTSESLGQRSANRGECAQACRMPYELVVDGTRRDLGDKKYLLSPQDLAAVEQIPRLLELGVVSFKIEGRLKSPEYVAAVCQVYRRAIDSALAGREVKLSGPDKYQLEMTFSRGLYPGWMHGVNHQELVGARYGKKRGAYIGVVSKVHHDSVEIANAGELKLGDGVVFDTGGDTNHEQGGRIYGIRGQKLEFQRNQINFVMIRPGAHVWKTSDPKLDEQLRQSFSGRIEARKRTSVDLLITGRAGEPLVVKASLVVATIPAGEHSLVQSAIALQPARTAPMTTERLRGHLGKFGDSGYELRELTNRLEGDLILPIGELNRLRRELVYALDQARSVLRPEIEIGELIPTRTQSQPAAPQLHVLCRSSEQLAAALEAGATNLYADFEDIRRYREAVAQVRNFPEARITLATPRIQKAGEQGFFKLIENCQPDALLVRNLGALSYYKNSPLPKIGDFSLNVANPLTAEHFIGSGVQRLTVSYDLNLPQLLALLKSAPVNWFEITLHQHMPMFHMEHCVFSAFLSKGTDYTNCGRPCESHRVHLRDRVGAEHPLRADVGCRNTLFNSKAQTGAQFFEQLRGTGLAHFRVELLEEDASQTRELISSYQKLLAGEATGETLWRNLRATSQLGVTTGTLVQV
ncbi:MAG TPA: U32 family peptidase [Chthoniobacterales bacterium]|jgi:putative protease